MTEAGDYDVIQVAGADATNLAEGSDTGREFVKANPLANPYPNLTYAVSGVTVNVDTPGINYNVDVTVPLINKVTVLKVASVASDTNGVIDVVVRTVCFCRSVDVIQPRIQ